MEFAFLRTDQFDIGADEILIGGDDLEAVHLGWDDGAGDFGVTEKDVVKCCFSLVLCYAETGGGIALGIGVDEENFQFVSGE